MSVEKDRLISLIEFTEQSARLRRKTVASVAEHGIFALYEEDIQELPGIRLDNNKEETEDEIWLAVERMQEVEPPEVDSLALRPWIQVPRTPTEEPQLRDRIEGKSLIDAGTHRSLEMPPEPGMPMVDPETPIVLSDFEQASLVRAAFATYVAMHWRPWAEIEKLRRRSIRLYSRLFTLVQQLEGSIVEAQLELVWGAGLGIWNFNGSIVRYPLVTRLVELSLNPVTAEVELRPRDVEARIEVDWYASVDNLGVSTVEKASKEFFGEAKTTFSPFDRSTFEPLLLKAVANLDANGLYWPTQVPAEDRSLPSADGTYKVTDTWVLFARPRTNDLFLQDLARMKVQAEDTDIFPGAVAAVVTDPETENPAIDLPNFRGVSGSYESLQRAGGKKARDLYFPKPFNDDQVRIVQLLDVYDGVVVQGPPGTGKTHTIANIICHYLAEGKRVLVTSMKDPALAVLQEQIPEEIRPLTISLLASEQQGMRQFEHAINKIASEVQNIDRTSTTRAISHLEELIDAQHAKIAVLDRRITEWATRNLTKVELETETIEPQDAAREIVEHHGQFHWIPDALGVDSEFAPQFSDQDVTKLREARRELGQDIEYLDAHLPQLVQFPDSRTLLDIHQDLTHFEKLRQSVEVGLVPALADSSQETLTLAQNLLAHVEGLQRLRDEVAQSRQPWTSIVRDLMLHGGHDDLFSILETLGAELEKSAESQKAFLRRPVSAPQGIELDEELMAAVRNLSEGKKPFGLKGLLGKSQAKKHLDSIRVLGTLPTDIESWAHVAEHLSFLRQLHGLAIRWNSIAPLLHIEEVRSEGPGGGVDAAQAYALYIKVKGMVRAEFELLTAVPHVFPHWAHSGEVADDEQRLRELEMALRHHITKNRLSSVWAAKERFQQVWEGCSGRVIDDIQVFVSGSLGNPEIDDNRMQAQWSALMAELSHALGLRSLLTSVGDICNKIEASGAPRYAALLKEPIKGSVDGLLPDNWRAAWRLKRLDTYLESVDAHEELKKLAENRHEIESDLSRAYRDIVTKRTWLKLAENASPSIRAALQAYLNAVQRIGKGTGKRAIRYRRDARMAASQANPAVPCWIMPHYRVSESLPSELGCFDLVIIDEASQSDLTALPSVLRGEKVLVVGDDKQVSPEGVGLEEDKIRGLMGRFLGSQVANYGAQMSPERSIYDLFKVVFAHSSLMLKEHFRCVAPIIEYSRREFYNYELRPLRIPRTSERLDPPLIDVVVEDGYRNNNDVNLPEARFIVNEIRSIVEDPKMSGRSIGVVSLLADKQAQAIWDRLTDEIGPELMLRHHVACGDARTFQGKERDIMFLSMVSAPNNVGIALSRDTFRQRFNVAASRAKDRMYLVRSVELEHLSTADALRRSLISHFGHPFAKDETQVENLRSLCESDFERDMYDELTQRGFWVTPQVVVGRSRIDLVVEGHNDARLAVECDGDKYHGPDKWADDMQRQRVMERAGWSFWRCFASAFYRRRKDVLEDLLETLVQRGIEPIGAEGAPRSVHTEHRVVQSVTEPVSPGYLGAEEIVDEPLALVPVVVPSSDSITERSAPIQSPALLDPDDSNLPSRWNIAPAQEAPELLKESVRSTQLPGAAVGSSGAGLSLGSYSEYSGTPGGDPRSLDTSVVAEGLIRIAEVEGPMLAKRAYDIYLRGCGIRRMGGPLKKTMNKALNEAIQQGRLVSVNEAGDTGFLFSTIRMRGSPPIRIRSRGPRSLEEIPPSELKVVAMHLLERHGVALGSDEHLRLTLDWFDLTRLTTQVRQRLLEILDREIPSVTDFIGKGYGPFEAQ